MPLPESTRVRLETQLECLPVLLSGIAQGVLERKPSPEKWSARENLAHLARYQEIFLDRLHKIRAGDQPVLMRYRAEDDPEWESWINRSWDEILRGLATSRKELIGRVEKLSDGDLVKIGTHSRFGEMSVAQWLEFFLLHEAHHLLTILQRTRS